MVEIPHLPLSSQTQIPKPFETYWQPTHSPLLWTHFWSCIWIFETKLGFEIFQCDCVLLLQAFDAWLLFKPRKRYDSRGRWAIKGGHPAWSRSENHGSFRRISSLKRFAPKDFKYNFLSLFVFFSKGEMNEAQHGSRRDFVRQYLHNDHEASTASMRCPRSRRLTFLDLRIHRSTNIPESLFFV